MPNSSTNNQQQKDGPREPSLRRCRRPLALAGVAMFAISHAATSFAATISVDADRIPAVRNTGDVKSHGGKEATYFTVAIPDDYVTATNVKEQHLGRAPKRSHPGSYHPDPY